MGVIDVMRIQLKDALQDKRQLYKQKNKLLPSTKRYKYPRLFFKPL